MREMKEQQSNVNEVAPERVREQLERILASEEFANSGRVSRFLRFSVEAKLRGEADQIKEYLLGREVFDRDDNYDPRMDPIVRVEARRLRSKLTEYYAGPGREDELVIGFPKGSYAPVIEPRGKAAELAAYSEAVPGRRPYLPYALLALLIGTAFAGYYLLRAQDGERIAAAPGGWLKWNAPGPNPFEDGLVETLTMELSRSKTIEVISWPSMLPYRDAHKPVRAIAKELNAAFVLIVSARNEGNLIHVTVHLVGGNTDRKLWFAEYIRPEGNSIAVQHELARAIAGELEAYRKSSR